MTKPSLRLCPASELPRTIPAYRLTAHQLLDLSNALRRLAAGENGDGWTVVLEAGDGAVVAFTRVAVPL